MTLKNNRAPLLSNIKICASFRHHMWIQTEVTVRKRLNCVLTFVTLPFDLWPWPFAWTSRLALVITSQNFLMIQWWEHSEKGMTDGRTDRQTERSVLRAAWSQLKRLGCICCRFIENVSVHYIFYSVFFCWFFFCTFVFMFSFVPSYL